MTAAWSPEYAASQLALCEPIARRQHEGQADKSGNPYILHAEAVARRLAAWPVRSCAGWLHDVPEDTPMTIGELRAEGVDEAVLVIVEAMTHRKGEPRDEYYERIKAAGPDAVRTKEADIEENERPDRHATIDAATSERLYAKYAKARRCLGLRPKPEASG